MNDQYQALYQTFRWLVPAQFNIAQSCCHQWAATPAHARSIAVFYEDEDSQREVWTYGRLAEAVNQLANGLVKLGVAPGDRVAVAMGQRPETVVACMAICSVGAMFLPLSAQFGPDALETRLRDAGAQVAVVDSSASSALFAAADRCPHLQLIIGVDLANERILPWRSLLARQPASFRPVATRASDPAVLLYPAGAAGAPRGVLLPHGALIGSLPGFVASQNWFPKHGDVFWSPADWAQADGLMGALLPTLYFGHAIVGTRGRFSPERAFDLLQRYQITNTRLAPVEIEALRHSSPNAREHDKLALRAVATTGAGLDEAARAWCETALGLAPNATFGQAEAHCVIGDSGKRWPARPGSMGRPYPGHRVAVIDEQGRACPAGQVGEVAVNRYDIHGHPDPALFLGYWNNEAATRDKFSGDWCRTGELARLDADGCLWPAARAEDVARATGTPPERLPQHPDISR
jgi:acetyl-CoA synthetase